MSEPSRTKMDLINEISTLKEKIQKLELSKTEHKRAEERLLQLNEVFLRFGVDPVANINMLVAFCGEMFDASCALYNRQQGGMLCALGQWNTPPDFNSLDQPEGHLCHDVIKSDENNFLIIRNLQDSPYAQTDPNVQLYQLQTYIGKAVTFGDKNVGSLCVVFQRDVIPSDNDVRLMGIIASAIGIEEKRKQAEEALRESEIFQNTLLKAIPVPVFYKDSDGHYLGFNNAFETFFGITREQLIGKTVFDISPPELAEIYHTKDTELFENREVQKYESQVKACGALRDVIFNKAVFTDRQGNISGLIGTILDVTESKRVGEVLVESEAKYRAVVDSSLVGVYIIQDGLFRFVNRRWCEIYGYTEGEIVDKMDPLDLTPPEDRKLLEENFRKRLSGEVDRIEYELKAIRKDGKTIRVRILGSSILFKGRPAISGTVYDITGLKQAEEALRISESNLRTILDSIDDAIFIHTISGKVIDVNKKMLDMYGVSHEEALSMAILRDFYAPDSFCDDLFEMWQSVSRGEKRVIEGKACRPHDNSIFPVEVFLRKIQLNNEDVILATVQDITERKRAEVALKESETKFRQIAEASAVGIYVIQDGIFKYVNKRYADIYGYPIEEILDRKGPPELTLPEDLPRVQENIRKKLSGESPMVHYEFRIVTKQNKIRYAEIYSSTSTYQGKTSIMGTLLDITERKLVEKALQESEAKYRNVVEYSLVGFYILDGSHFQFVNKRFCDMFGYTEDEIIGKLGPGDLTYPEDKALVESNIKKRLTNKTDYVEYEFRVVRKDGRVIPVVVLGSFIIHNGRRHATGSIIDLTREKNLESQLVQSQKMEAIGTLAGGVAHDFNNLLTVIAGYGSLLQNSIDSADPLQTYVDQILSSTEKAADLTKGLLAFSRKQILEPKPLNLSDKIRQSKQILSRLISEDIILSIDPGDKDTIIMADANQIDQILFNLATNARDAMPLGGTLTVSTELIDLDAAAAAVRGIDEAGLYALITVSDTGCGMDGTTMTHVFDPFFTTKEVGKGTGLGLSTVYGIVKQHKGYINVYSEEGQGTTFRIYMPAVRMEVEEEKKPSSEGITGGRETILVAEDSADLRALMREILTQYGYTIIEARDGEEAVEQFKRNPNIDLLILDSVMPKKNGREAYNEIHSIEPAVKVLFTSGYTRDVILNKGIGDKEFPFVSKPLLPVMLLKRVREVLDDMQNPHKTD